MNEAARRGVRDETSMLTTFFSLLSELKMNSNAINIKTQFIMSTVNLLIFAFRLNSQVGLGSEVHRMRRSADMESVNHG
jgi:hypothetical protein